MTVLGGAAAFVQEPSHLQSPWGEPPAGRETFEVVIKYACRPRAGLYFIGPDADYPDRPPMRWTQGQDEDDRYFGPARPADEKAAAEVVFSRRRPLSFALSNGDLRVRTKRANGPRTRFITH